MNCEANVAMNVELIAALPRWSSRKLAEPMQRNCRLSEMRVKRFMGTVDFISWNSHSGRYLSHVDSHALAVGEPRYFRLAIRAFWRIDTTFDVTAWRCHQNLPPR